MKVLKTVALKKYNNLAKYSKKEDAFYSIRGKNNYCVTLYCELEEGETEEDPLLDILQNYNVRQTAFSKYNEIDGKKLFMFEVEGDYEDDTENLKAIRTVSKFVGKRVYNAEVGEFLELKVKALKDDEK